MNESPTSLLPCAHFLFLGCSPMCLYFCLFKFRPALMPQTLLGGTVATIAAQHKPWLETQHHIPLFGELLPSRHLTSASIRWSLVMVKVGPSYRQELLLSTGSNLFVATGIHPLVWDDFGQRLPIVLIPCGVGHACVSAEFPISAFPF